MTCSQVVMTQYLRGKKKERIVPSLSISKPFFFLPNLLLTLPCRLYYGKRYIYVKSFEILL